MISSALLSALYAGLVAIGATVAIERLGGRLGGLLGSVPTTIIPASLGFWWTAGNRDIFQDALFAVPAGMMVNAIFLYSWRILPGKLPPAGLAARLLMMTFLSLGIWALIAVGFVWVMGNLPFSVFVAGCTFFLVQLFFGVWACQRNPPAPKGANRVGWVVLCARGVLAATAIGISVWISALGNPLLAGMASVFPAIFLTTMVSVWMSQGEAVQAGAVGPMMLGSGSVSLYALSAAFLIPQFGLLWGALSAWLIAVSLLSFPAWLWLRR